jgi:hypothetical protein
VVVVVAVAEPVIVAVHLNGNIPVAVVEGLLNVSSITPTVAVVFTCTCTATDHGSDHDHGHGL